MAILERISTGRMLALAADLEALDRTVGGPEMDQVCERVASVLGGVDRVELRSYPCGSEHRVLGWSMERRPFVDEAELWLVGQGGAETLICRRTDNPACSMGAFRSTPEGGDVFEVVDVGYGTRPSDYRSHRMAGKLALASGHQFQAAILEALAQRQASGLLCGPGTEGLDPTHVVRRSLGDPSLFSPHRPFGFNLSAVQLNQLGNLLAAGDEVRLRVKLHASMDRGDLPTLGATLQGATERDERVLLVACSGQSSPPLAVACLVEILRAISTLVVQGRLAPLHRSLQLLLVPDPYAAVAWLHEQQSGEGGPIRAALLLELPSAEAAARVTVQSPSAVRPSFVADLLDDHLRWARRVRSSFRGDVPMWVEASQHVDSSWMQPLVDRAAGLCAVGLRCSGKSAERSTLHGPLHRLTAALAWAALDLCQIDPQRDLARLLASSQLKGVERLTRRAEQLRERIRDELDPQSASSGAARHLLWLCDSALQEGLRREQQVLQSCGEYTGGAGQLALELAEANAAQQQVQHSLGQALRLRISGAVGPRTRLVARRRRLSALERRADAVVVRRVGQGPLPGPSLLRDAQGADRTWLAHNSGALAQQPVGDRLLQWVDGQRSLRAIVDQLSLDWPDVDLKLLWRYLEVLEAQGQVELQERATVFTPGEQAGEG